MAMLLLLLPNGRDLALGAEAATQLAGLGISTVALLRDSEGAGVLLEGWSFDPIGSGALAGRIVGGDADRGRTLRPVMQIAVDALARSDGPVSPEITTHEEMA